MRDDDGPALYNSADMTANDEADPVEPSDTFVYVCDSVSDTYTEDWLSATTYPTGYATIVTMNGCNYCDLASQLLNDNCIETFLVDLDDVGNRDEAEDAFNEATDSETVPKVFYNGEFVGGFSSLK